MAKISGPRQKAWRPKVKTGCITCRFRRIKCDEAKPHCRRCVSTGRKCDGYTVPSKPSSVESSLAPPVFMGPSAWTGTLQEQQSFHFFQEHTAKDFFGVFGFSNWIQDILLASSEDTALRHAITGLGALHRKFLTGNLYISLHGGPVDHEMQFALQQCNESIRCLLYGTGRPTDSSAPMKQRLIEKPTALAACMLYTCFSSLQGHQAEAVAHIRFGLKILAEIETNGNNSVQWGASPIPTRTLRSIFTNLDTQARAVLCESHLFTWAISPAFYILDDPSELTNFETLTDVNSAVEELMNAVLTYIRLPTQISRASLAIGRIYELPPDQRHEACYLLFVDRFAMLDSELTKLLSKPSIMQELRVSSIHRKALSQLSLHRTLAEVVLRIFGICVKPDVELEMGWDDMDALFSAMIRYAAEVLDCPESRLNALTSRLHPPKRLDEPSLEEAVLDESVFGESVFNESVFDESVLEDLTKIDPTLLGLDPSPARRPDPHYCNPNYGQQNGNSYMFPSFKGTHYANADDIDIKIDEYFLDCQQETSPPPSFYDLAPHRHAPRCCSSDVTFENAFPEHPNIILHHSKNHIDKTFSDDFLPQLNDSSLSLMGSCTLTDPKSDHKQLLGPNPVFSCTSQIIQPLFTCATRCRNPTLRRRALALLIHHPRQEGIWSSGVSARIAIEAMQIEEHLALKSQNLTAAPELERLYIPWNCRVGSIEISCGCGASATGSKYLRVSYWTVEHLRRGRDAYYREIRLG